MTTAIHVTLPVSLVMVNLGLDLWGKMRKLAGSKRPLNPRGRLTHLG